MLAAFCVAPERATLPKAASQNGLGWLPNNVHENDQDTSPTGVEITASSVAN